MSKKAGISLNIRTLYTRKKPAFERDEEIKAICAWHSNRDLQVKTSVRMLGPKIRKTCVTFKRQKKYKGIQSSNARMKNVQNCVFIVRTPLCSVPMLRDLKN